MRQATFAVVHAVDFSQGTAKIGKCHVIDKAEELREAEQAKKVKKMQEKNKIVI